MKQIDSERAEQLVQTYADLILRVSYTYLKSTYDAEDICQTVLLRVLTDGRAFESAEHERAFIIRTTRNACKDALRGAFRRKTVALDAAGETAAPEAPDSSVLDAVMALPQKYREAVYLHYYEGYAIEEIANLTGRSKAAVAAHLSRGRKQLRLTLEGELQNV